MEEKIIQRLVDTHLTLFSCNSRVHPLRSFPKESRNWYVKREDELSFGLSGTKLRKYLSLLPALLKQKPHEVALIGSAYSNHIVSFSQLLRENGIQPVIFIKGRGQKTLEGNLLYSSILVGNSHMHWIPNEEWADVNLIVSQYVLQKEKQNLLVPIVPEGGNCNLSLPGTLTLGLDILRNERELKIAFDHIFIDSGTGMTASGLILLFSYLKKKTSLHVIQMAGDDPAFKENLNRKQLDFETWLNDQVESQCPFNLYFPSTARAFGSTNQAVFQTVLNLAREEGFLTDPIFTAKLFYEARHVALKHNLKGNILIIHSGGGLGLTGFQSQLAAAFQKIQLKKP